MLNASNFEFFAQGRPSFINLSARYSSLRQCMSATPSLMSLYVLDREKQEFVPSMIQVTRLASPKPTVISAAMAHWLSATSITASCTRFRSKRISKRYGIIATGKEARYDAIIALDEKA